MEDCICKRKPIFDKRHGIYCAYASTKYLVDGHSNKQPSLAAGPDRNGDFTIFIESGKDSSYYYPKFCPECGRKLRRCNASD
jgi:hypothetical protein